MKKKSIILFICLIIIMSTIACEDTAKRDTPMLASSAMKIDMSLGNYDGFISSHMQGRESVISKEQFNEIKSLITSVTTHETYELLKFDNGEMILVEFAPIPEDGEFKIQGIEIVPDEMKEFFK